MALRGCVFLSLLALAGAAAPARAQSCWPVGVVLMVRDSLGKPISPRALDAPRLDGKATRGGPYIGTPAYQDTAGAPEGIRFPVTTPCRMKVGEVTLEHGGKRMRLVFGIELDSDRRRGPSSFAIEAPPFRSGTFVLDWRNDPPGGGPSDPEWIRADRWRPAPEAAASPSPAPAPPR